MKNKKLIIALSVVILLIIIFVIINFFLKKFNKKLDFGNNFTNKTNQEIEEYILNISSYKAKIEVTVESNKNTTKYIINQNYISPNLEKQIIEQPSNISGLETIYDGNVLTIKNTKLNLTTVYKDYQYITDNFLWLNSFIEEYRNAKNQNDGAKIYEENDMVIMEVDNLEEGSYISDKKLFIDKTTGKINKMIVQDKNQKNIVYILYNEIEINSLKKEEILAFKLNDTFVGQY